MYILTDIFLKHQYKRAKKLETITAYLLNKGREAVYNGNMLESDYKHLFDIVKYGDIKEINNHLIYNYGYKILDSNK